MDQSKLERLLRLMKLLTANTTYDIDQLAERLQMSRKWGDSLSRRMQLPLFLMTNPASRKVSM